MSWKQQLTRATKHNAENHNEQLYDNLKITGIQYLC